MIEKFLWVEFWFGFGFLGGYGEVGCGMWLGKLGVLEVFKYVNSLVA